MRVTPCTPSSTSNATTTRRRERCHERDCPARGAAVVAWESRFRRDGVRAETGRGGVERFAKGITAVRGVYIVLVLSGFVEFLCKERLVRGVLLTSIERTVL